MTKKIYKKLFVIGAALFVIFAPVGMTMKAPVARAQNDNLETQTPVVTTLIPTEQLQTLPSTPAATTPATSAAAGTPTPVTSPNIPEATDQTPDLWDHPITGSVYYVTYTVDNIMTLAVVAGAFLVRLMLQFNDNIFNSPAVLTGFSVSLAIANLGFVLGIIIIAIATIIRNQTYGIKQLLWKLVVMAILVNFGLVITAPIVGFAGSMSNYFINATSPSSATGGYEAYVSTMMQAFAPQQINGASTAGCNNPTGGTAELCNLQNGKAKPSDTPSTFVQSILSLFFGIALLGLIAFTFFCLAILLLVRYLMLAGLLIVLPLAWLTYVFPKFDNSYSKWWNTFIKWTFFPPLALFFIYLAFTAATNTGGAASQNSYLQQAAGLPTNAVTGPEAALVYQTGLAGPIQQAADEILLVGLTIMGLMFANSLSGKAGSTVVNGMTSASKSAAGYMGKKSKRVAGRMIPDKAKEALQGGKIPLLPKRLQIATGLGLGSLQRSGRGGMVAEESKHAEELAKNPEEFARILSAKAGSFGMGGTNKPRQMAMLAQLAKDEDLQKEVKKQGNMVGEVTLQEFLRGNEGEFKRLQQDKLYKTLKDKSELTPLDLSEKGAAATEIVSELGGKVKLQEIKDTKESIARGDSVDADQLKKVSDHDARKKDLETRSALGETMSDKEKTELTTMRAMEKTSGKYMTDEEQVKYKKAKEDFDESQKDMKKWMTENPELAANSFQNHEKAIAELNAKGQKIPLTFDSAAVKQMQQSMITAMAEGFSPQNARGLIEAIGKKNNLKYFERATDKMEANVLAHIQTLAAENKPLASWVQNNPGKTVVDLNKMFNIAPKKKKKDEDDDE